MLVSRRVAWISTMATRRQKEKSAEAKSKRTETTVSSRTLRQRKPKRVEDEDQSSYMSLDVLAQVASATLEKEPKQKGISSKKLSKRSIQSLEELNLEQIQRLSDNALLSFFSEMVANEMTRNFTYTCHLIPNLCQEKFRSFGNETQARIKMRNHLHKHIEQLIDEQNDPDKKVKTEFNAVPLHIRERKIQELTSSVSKKRCRDVSGTYVYMKTSKPGVNNKLKFTALKPSTSNNTKNQNCEDNRNSTELLVNSDAETSMFNDNNEGDENDSNLHIRRSLRKSTSQKSVHKQTKTQNSASDGKKSSRSDKSKKDRSGCEGSESEDSVLGETERRIEENEQFIIDLLSRTQPHHDHCYTTIFGKKKGIDDIEFDSGEEDESGDIDVGDNSQYFGKTVIYQTRKSEPILCLGNVSVMDELSSSGTGSDEASKTIIVCAEEIIDDSPEEELDLVEGIEKVGHSGRRPYPPMPKYPIARRGRVNVLEETLSEEDDPIIGQRKKKKGEKEGSAEWERKAALKCIRDLKAKRKDERYLLHCRICKDKTFTASATLMYHYRSHAGIKPFVCLICNTTFTRQHSLNYHMLIHNNQSRFTCKDCGRKFRHPSHFKEHLRRHTGETPFVCTDCPQRFKTRNTYKRHLKTRHGKLLTAAGIQLLSVEEFAKIRTKPYRRIPDRPIQQFPFDEELPVQSSITATEKSNDSGDNSSTISVTEDLGELVDIKLEMDEALAVEQDNLPSVEDNNMQNLDQSQVVVKMENPTTEDSPVVAEPQKQGPEKVRKIIIPFGFNITVNS